MGVADLRDAFNAAAPGFSCTRALLHYERAHDTEWQILSFSGVDDAGVPFDVRSDPIPPSGSLEEAVVQAAQRAVAEAVKPVIVPETPAVPTASAPAVPLADGLKALDSAALSDLNDAVAAEMKTRADGAAAAEAAVVQAAATDGAAIANPVAP